MQYSNKHHSSIRFNPSRETGIARLRRVPTTIYSCLPVLESQDLSAVAVNEQRTDDRCARRRGFLLRSADWVPASASCMGGN